MANVAELSRHNQSTEEEAYRHNLSTEGISKTSNQISANSVATDYFYKQAQAKIGFGNLEVNQSKVSLDREKFSYDTAFKIYDRLNPINAVLKPVLAGR